MVLLYNYMSHKFYVDPWHDISDNPWYFRFANMNIMIHECSKRTKNNYSALLNLQYTYIIINDLNLIFYIIWRLTSRLIQRFQISKSFFLFPCGSRFWCLETLQFYRIYSTYVHRKDITATEVTEPWLKIHIHLVINK